MPSEPLDHVRRSDLPWRTMELTECGRPLSDVGAYIDRDQLQARLRAWGKQRTSMHTCMTCWTASTHNPTFEHDPVQAMSREVRGAMWTKEQPQLAAELRALAALAVKYRDEFDDFVTGLGEAASLAQHRRDRQMR